MLIEVMVGAVLVVRQLDRDPERDRRRAGHRRHQQGALDPVHARPAGHRADAIDSDQRAVEPQPDAHRDDRGGELHRQLEDPVGQRRVRRGQLRRQPGPGRLPQADQQGHVAVHQPAAGHRDRAADADGRPARRHDRLGDRQAHQPRRRSARRRDGHAVGPVVQDGDHERARLRRVRLRAGGQLHGDGGRLRPAGQRAAGDRGARRVPGPRQLRADAGRSARVDPRELRRARRPDLHYVDGLGLDHRQERRAAGRRQDLPAHRRPQRQRGRHEPLPVPRRGRGLRRQLHLQRPEPLRHRLLRPDRHARVHGTQSRRRAARAQRRDANASGPGS